MEILMVLMFIIIIIIIIMAIEKAIKNSKEARLNDLKSKIEAENHKIDSEYNKNFYPTEIVSCCMGIKRYIEVDISNKKWRINKTSQNDVPIYTYNDLRDFELLEKSNGFYTESNAFMHGNTYSNASTTPIIVFGDAIKNTSAYSHTFANTHTKAATIEDKEIIIRISFKDVSARDEYILFNKTETDDTFVDAEMCMSLLRRIKAHNEENKTMIEAETTHENDFSVADELTKLKSLLDDGIITEEEFNKQKAKLL